jgi:undecaprenyl diphosphate synthase
LHTIVRCTKRRRLILIRMAEKDDVNLQRLPEHVAIIMDGNGRWAKKRGNQRIFGHKNGVKAVRETVEASAELGIKYLTLYAFSTENWKRPRTEVDALMALLVSTINSETSTLMDNNVRLLTIGDTKILPTEVLKKLNSVIELTKDNDGMSLVLALSYSSRWELVEAVKNLCADVEGGTIKASDVDGCLFEQYLNTAGFPEPELLIRTSGELRLSNFLLWQLAYAELYFTEVLWPDFRRNNFYDALVAYQNRERRFGKTSEQLNESTTR